VKVIYFVIFLLSIPIILGADFYFPIVGTLLIVAVSLFVIGKIVKTKKNSEIAFYIFLITVAIAITKKSIGYFSSGYMVNTVLGYHMDHSLSMIILLGLVTSMVIVLKIKRNKVADIQGQEHAN
jgi:cytochrome c biogenesis factor